MNKPIQSPAQPIAAPTETPVSDAAMPQEKPHQNPAPLPPEFGGRKGPEATRYGDWEMNGKCVDF